MVKKCRPCSQRMSKACAMFGWCRVAARRASSRNMRTRSGAAARWGRRHLQTASFWKPSMPTARARWISAMPPTARRSISSYLPSRVAGAGRDRVPTEESLEVGPPQSMVLRGSIDLADVAEGAAHGAVAGAVVPAVIAAQRQAGGARGVVGLAVGEGGEQERLARHPGPVVGRAGPGADGAPPEGPEELRADEVLLVAIGDGDQVGALRFAGRLGGHPGRLMKEGLESVVVLGIDGPAGVLAQVTGRRRAGRAGPGSRGAGVGAAHAGGQRRGEVAHGRHHGLAGDPLRSGAVDVVQADPVRPGHHAQKLRPHSQLLDLRIVRHQVGARLRAGLLGVLPGMRPIEPQVTVAFARPDKVRVAAGAGQAVVVAGVAVGQVAVVALLDGLAQETVAADVPAAGRQAGVVAGAVAVVALL